MSSELQVRLARVAWIGLLAGTFAGCSSSSREVRPSTPPPATAGSPGAATATDGKATLSHPEQIQAWRERRVRNLTSDTGWLTVAGLFWLQAGENSFGTDAGNDIVLPPDSAPARAGVFVHEGSKTTIRGAPGTPLLWRDKPIESLLMRSDAEDTTDVVALNKLRFFVIKRGERWGIRMRDLDSKMRQQFKGIESYPIDSAYRIEARFEPYVPARKIPIVNVIGTVDSMDCPGALVFELQGKTLRLDPVLESPEDTSLFLIFKDETSGDETYGAGRFLYTDLPKDGKTLVDFNKAYNPPCAFTAFATCPLPPAQNELHAAIRAGEKNYGEH